ncbi:MAG: sigma-70 family RNA polymerase sigma factor [Phycisphaerales bacterium]|nr:sigma-70 family RNA polymerase sigma factor [Phycisphaerales bacterium]
MDSHLQTTTTLLEGLLDARNDTVWREFAERYQPVILGIARRLGLDDQDAADAAQETLIRFLQEYRAGKYDRQKGRLGAWITSMARFRVADSWRAKARDRKARGDSVFDFVPSDDELERLWDEECRREIIRKAMQRLSDNTNLNEQTIALFRGLTLEQKRPTQVAKEHGVSIDVVYKSKQRCLAQLRTIIDELNAAYELD